MGPLFCRGPQKNPWPDTYAECHIGSTAAKPGGAANKTAQNKIDRYAKLASTQIFYPLPWRQLAHGH